ncbi:hypothetical protein GPDM_15971 [Planococcus donghaensis MPA1U2]|uniref:Uncharacterized protein n=1 Tax=Planococcus donghaensis MPA1U2 TaxID=933115 RepID=E7RL19_9BACL|nr:hypothetical protein [Planococcus donghaensis]EGA88297.1 hypothetical protein GPDM_15971 [Planococcus donghaensis MPA1U2]
MFIAISKLTHTYTKPVLELKDNLYAIKNINKSKIPKIKSVIEEERKMKKKGKIQKITQAYTLNHGFLGNI